MITVNVIITANKSDVTQYFKATAVARETTIHE